MSFCALLKLHLTLRESRHVLRDSGLARVIEAAILAQIRNDRLPVKPINVAKRFSRVSNCTSDTLVLCCDTKKEGFDVSLVLLCAKLEIHCIF